MKFSRVISFIAAILCITGLLGCSANKEPVSHSGVDFIMNTFVEQRWYGDKAEQTYNEITDALREVESRLSLFVEESEITELNRQAGKSAVKLSSHSYQLLKEAVGYCEESGGMFDITIAPLTLVWNVTAAEPEIPTESEIKAAQQLVNYKNIIFDDAAQTVMLAKEGMSIDLGGIAKGTAAGLTRQYAEKNGVSGFVSIGGNIMMHGKKPDGNDFIIGVRDPRGSAEEFIATVHFDGLTMATTGDYERYFEKDGVRYHHIIDPFSGRPSESDLISVTVFSANGTLADCYSTSIFLQGSENLHKFLNRDDCMVLAVTKDFEVYASEALQQRIVKNSAKSQYHFNF